MSGTPTTTGSPTLHRPRPISPHLSVYRFEIPAITSITHRITGSALAFGTLLFTAWLWAAAYSPAWFDTLQGWGASLPGQALLFLFSLAFFYHLCNGIRHLCWDIGLGFEIGTAMKTGYLAIGAALALTAVTWFYIWM